MRRERVLFREVGLFTIEIASDTHVVVNGFLLHLDVLLYYVIPLREGFKLVYQKKTPLLRDVFFTLLGILLAWWSPDKLLDGLLLVLQVI